MPYRIPWIRIIIILAFVAVIVGSAERMMRGHGSSAPPGGQPIIMAPPSSPAPGSIGTAAGSQPPTSATTLAAAADAAVRAELKEAAKLLTQTADSVDQALAQITAWENEIEPLRSNADGRAVAAHTDLARQMAYLLQQPRPARAELQDIHDRVRSLQRETDRLAALTPAQKLAPDKLIEVHDLNRRSQDAKSLWTDAVERAQAIVRKARRQQSLNATTATSAPAAAAPASGATSPITPDAATNPTIAPPAGTVASAASPTPSVSSPSAASNTPAVAPSPPAQEPPLPSAAADPATAVAAQPGPHSQSSAASKTLEQRVAEISDQQKLDALNKKMAGDAERQRELERLEEVRRKLAKKVAAEKEKLVAEASSAEVQQLLQPFLARRNIQPRLAGASLQWRPTVEQQPMSLSALENVGALADSVSGLSMLARVGSHRELSSPRWEFNPSPRTWTSDTQDRLKQAQDLLRRLGPTLVNEKLLSP